MFQNFHFDQAKHVRAERWTYGDRMTSKYGERKHKETSALIALAGTLMKHTTIGLAALL